MRSPSLLGVWRLESLTRRGRRTKSSHTHLVVHEQELWEICPRQVYYEDAPGPERAYVLTWEGDDGRLEITHLEKAAGRSILRLFGDELQLRHGPKPETFPKSFYDEKGTFAVYERENGAAAETLLSPRPRKSRPRLEHPALGTLLHDAKLEWWQSEVRFGDRDRVRFRVEGGLRISVEALDRAGELLETVRCEDLCAYAASRLLDLKNGSWLGDGEDVFDATAFAAKMSPASFGVRRDGSVSVFFDDGDLFSGHSIIVTLNAEREPIDAEIAG